MKERQASFVFKPALSRARPHGLTNLRPPIMRPRSNSPVFGFDRIGGSDIRVEFRLPGQGIGRETFRTNEEHVALDRALPRIRQWLGAGGRIVRIWILPDTPAGAK